MTSVAVRPWAPAAVTASTRSSVTSGSTIAVISFMRSASSRTCPAARLTHAVGRGQGRRSARAGSTVPGAGGMLGPWPVAAWAAARSPVGEDDPDLSGGEGHWLAGGGGGEGGAAVGGGAGPAGGPGFAVAQDHGGARAGALRVRRGLAVFQEPGGAHGGVLDHHGGW